MKFRMTMARISSALAVLLVAATPAGAHESAGIADGFASGFMHPLGGLDHLLAMASVGIWGAFLGRPLIWSLPVTFPMMMVVGGVIGILGLPLPHVEVGIAASVVVLGAAIALAWKAGPVLALAVVAAFALFHGYAHGTELPDAASPEAYAAGFVLSTGMIHLAGMAIGLLAASRQGFLALRLLGAGVSLTGLWILAGALGFAAA